MSFQKINLEDNTRNIDKISIIVYGYHEEEIKIIESYCKEQQVDFIFIITDKMLEMTIEDILDAKKYINSSTSPINAKVIIMNGFSGKDIQSFLKNFNHTELERPIFATVTPISKKWTIKALINELLEEHKIMKK